MNTDQKQNPAARSISSPMAIVGAILAQGVIRLIEGQYLLAKLTEERVHTGVLTTKENTQ